jgi:putative peptidoglycan lipid II flippase
LLLAPSLGIKGVAIGAVIGAGLHAAVQLPALIRTGLRLQPVRNPLAVEGVGEVLRLLGPRVIGQAAFQINFIWITSLATTSGSGESSGLSFAWQMLMLPHGLIALSISTVIFPKMARQFELKRLDQVRDTFGQSLTPLLFLMIPASVGLFVFRTAIVRAVLEHGRFDAADTQLVGQAVGFLGLGLVWYGVVEVVTRIFYAMKDTRTPVIAGLIIIAVNITLAWFLVDDYGAGGLAIGLTVSTGIEALILMAVLRRRIGGFGDAFAGWLGKVLLATAAMAGMAALSVPKMERAVVSGDRGQIVSVAALAYTAGLVGSTYLTVAWLLKIPEAIRFERLLLDRLGRSRSGLPPGG